MDSGRTQKLTGMALMVGSVLIFVVMNVLVKASRIPSGEKVFFRMLVGLFAVFVMVRISWVRMEFNNIPLLALRGVLGAFAVVFYFHAIDNTALGRAVFFQFTYPAWGALFSYLFLKESLGWKRLPALAGTFVGAYLILASGGGLSLREIRPGDISGILCGLFSGAAVTTVRACHKYDSTYMIFLNFAFFGTLAGAVITFGREGYIPPSHWEWALLAAIGVTGTAAQILFTAGYRHLDVPAAGAIATFQAPLSALVGWRLFEEPLATRFALGGALVLAGGIYLAVSSRGKTIERAAIPEPPSE